MPFHKAFLTGQYLSHSSAQYGTTLAKEAAYITDADVSGCFAGTFARPKVLEKTGLLSLKMDTQTPDTFATFMRKLILFCKESTEILVPSILLIICPNIAVAKNIGNKKRKIFCFKTLVGFIMRNLFIST